MCTEQKKLNLISLLQQQQAENQHHAKIQRQIQKQAYLLAMLDGMRVGKRMESQDHLTDAAEAGAVYYVAEDDRPKKYNRARVLLGKRSSSQLQPQPAANF